MASHKRCHLISNLNLRCYKGLSFDFYVNPAECRFAYVTENTPTSTTQELNIALTLGFRDASKNSAVRGESVEPPLKDIVESISYIARPSTSSGRTEFLETPLNRAGAHLNGEFLHR